MCAYNECMKHCYACEATLPFAEFCKDKSRKGGLRNICRKCAKMSADTWRAAHPLEVAAVNRRSHARRRGATVFGDIPLTIKADLVALYGPHCLFPGCTETELTFDHVISVAKGGSHTMDNLQLLCRFHNNSKHDGTIDYRLDALRPVPSATAVVRLILRAGVEKQPSRVEHH